MTSALYVVRCPLQTVEPSLLSQSDVSSSVIGVEKALSSSTHFAEVLCDNPGAEQSSGQALTAEDLLELAYRHPKVIVL
jgi:hypothetical protein